MGQGFLPENETCDSLAATTGEWVDCNGVIDVVPGVGELNRLTQMGKGIAKGNVGDIVEGGSMAVVNAAFDVCGFFTLGLCKAPQAALKIATAPVRAVTKKAVGAGTKKVVEAGAEKTALQTAKQITKNQAKVVGGIAALGTITEAHRQAEEQIRLEQNTFDELKALAKARNYDTNQSEHVEQHGVMLNNAHVADIAAYHKQETETNARRDAQLTPGVNATLLHNAYKQQITEIVEIPQDNMLIYVVGGTVLLLLLLSEM